MTRNDKAFVAAIAQYLAEGIIIAGKTSAVLAEGKAGSKEEAQIEVEWRSWICRANLLSEQIRTWVGEEIQMKTWVGEDTYEN